MNIKEMETAAGAACGLLRILSNEKRLRILCQLADSEKPAGALAPLVGLRQSALSQHLARLRHEGVVKTRREAQTIYYSLASTEAVKVIEVLYDLFCPKKKRTPAKSHATGTKRGRP